MSKIYEILRNNQNLSGKLKVDEANGCIDINFNEYLHLSILVPPPNHRPEYTITLNDDLTHWHDDEEDFLESLTEIANGSIIFIENRCRFSFNKIKIMEKEKFEKKKERYFSRRHLRIYTGNSIMKRDNRQV